MSSPYQRDVLGLGLLAVAWTYKYPFDFIIISSLCQIRNKDGVQYLIERYVNNAIGTQIACTATCVLLLFQVFRYINGLQATSTNTDGFPAKPMIIRCATSHTRLSPNKHSFTYSYLLAGVPVGWKGSVGGMLSADDEEQKGSWLSMKPRRTWLVVSGDDYLGRGHSVDGLEGKLRDYLQSQGINQKEYPYAYLITAARLLNYSSNPVSIWYLYCADRTLGAIILEVNNTFDERHIYFVKPELSNYDTSADRTKAPRYKNNWPKDFYVSVFNSREGSYSLSTSDPLYPSMTGEGQLDVTITLLSSDRSPTLTARVFSTSSSLWPASMTVIQKTTFLLSWWYVGFSTFPRTVVQAVTILTRKKMPWVFRPEPRRNTIPRSASETEKCIERLFRKYLHYLVEKEELPIRVRYTPAGLVDTSTETLISPSAQLSPEVEEMEVKVLTPLFYSRFIRYTADALFCEPSTIFISNPTSSFLHAINDPVLSSAPNPGIKWRFLQFMRTAASPIMCREEPAIVPLYQARRGGHTSSFEVFVREHCSESEQTEYRARISKMYVSDYVALGWEGLLDLEIFVLRIFVLWNVSGWFVKYICRNNENA